MLHDLKQMLSRNEDVEETALKEAAYSLLSRQFLYRSKPLHRRHYDLIVRFQNYFSSLFDALNYQLIIDESHGYSGIFPRNYTWRMSLDETLILLAFRFIYDEEINAFHVADDGSISLSLEDFEDRYMQFAKRPLPETKGGLKELFSPFVRYSVIEFGQDEEVPTSDRMRIRILPGIASLLSGEPLKRLEVYLRAEDVDTAEQTNMDVEG